MPNQVISFIFTTHTAAGANVAPSSAFEAADIRIYKEDSATERSSSAGITMTSPFDSLTGVHCVKIDLSDNTDAGFYVTGKLYHVLLVPDETIDGQAVSVVLANFGIAQSAAAQRIAAPYDLDTGDSISQNLYDVYEVLVNVISSTLGVPSNFGSGATLAGNLMDIEAQTDDIGAAGAGLTALASAAALAVVDDFLDTEIAAIKAKTDALPASPAAVGSAMTLSSSAITSSTFASGAITAAGIAADAIGASELAADALAEIADAVLDEALSGHSTAGTLGKALTDVLNAVTSTGVTIASATMTSIADALLKRDLSAVTGEASRSALNALRFLRNKWSVSGSTLTVTKEDDTTSAWTAAVTTNASADPVTAVDPS